MSMIFYPFDLGFKGNSVKIDIFPGDLLSYLQSETVLLSSQRDGVTKVWSDSKYFIDI